MRRFLVWVGVWVLLLGAGVLWWLHHALTLSAPVLDLSVEPGTTPRGVAQAVVDSGVRTSPRLLYELFRWSGQARQIKAGSYELETGLTPLTLLAKLTRGEEALRAVTLVEGWNLRQMRQALAKAEQLQPESQALTPAQLMQALGQAGRPAEGSFYPDTYTYAKGSSDLAVLRRAQRAMDHHLAAAWNARQADLPLKNPQELLTLASIVEKETGRASDRAMIAAVFINRLRLGMPLQTDPTVIYGLGDKFDGDLRRRDLRADTPWNTYTRAGLPPTPIAMPGKAALLATAQPSHSRALYFVARGDGSSEFSDSLEAHNRAVDTYQRKLPAPR